MNLEDLRSFVTVVDHGGFRAAADVLAVAQPSLTRRIQRLEAELNTQLLERGPAGIRVTPKGDILLKGARRILSTVEEVEAATTGKWSEVIRLGAAATAAGSFLARFLASWIPSHPEVRLIMIEDGARNMRRRLESRDCDLGLIAAPIPRSFEHRFVTTVTVQALFPTGHRFARSREPLPVKQLHGEPVLLNGSRFLSTELFQSVCRISGSEPEIVYECSIGQTLAALAESGLGIAVMGDSVDLRGFHLPGRYLCDDNGNLLAFDLHIAWSRERVLAPQAYALVEDLAQYAVDQSKGAAAEK